MMESPERAPTDCSALYGQGPAPEWARPAGPVPLEKGPHLLVDDFLIERIAPTITRETLRPARDPAMPNPIVTGPVDRCFQPFFRVSRAPETGRWRVWYGAWRDDLCKDRSLLAYMESADGIHWQRPPRICDTPEIQFGSKVIDEGPGCPDPDTRFRYSYWFGGGLRIAVSADGLRWRPLVDEVVLPHDHDINNVWFDPLRRRYVATFSTNIPSPRWAGRRRTTMQAFSADLLHWSPPAYVLVANPAQGDEGETQFYAMSGYLARGSLVMGMVKVLRDDLTAERVEPGAFGIGYTALAWSRDGEHWMRDRAPFFEPQPDPAAWDHSHAWIDEQVIVDDAVRLYYGGYKQGHKANRFTERQIGLVTMLLDRYAARCGSGLMRTVPFRVGCSCAGLRVNVDASQGELRVQALDAGTNEPLPGLSFETCRPIRTDGLRVPVVWTHPAAAAAWQAAGDRCVRLEFQFDKARLFGFEAECNGKAT